MSDKEAMELLRAERQRQITVEGWTPEHDDEHGDGEMLHAAMVYLHHGTELAARIEDGKPIGWPWEPAWFKPKDRRSNLIRAGALMLAERERIARRGGASYAGHIDHKIALCCQYLADTHP